MLRTRNIEYIQSGSHPLMSSITGGRIDTGGRGLPLLRCAPSRSPIQSTITVLLQCLRVLGAGWSLLKVPARRHGATAPDRWKGGRSGEKSCSLPIGLATDLRVSDTPVAPCYHSTCDFSGSRTLYLIDSRDEAENVVPQTKISQVSTVQTP